MVAGNGNHKPGVSLHTKILLGFVVGATLGLLANQSVALGALSSARLESFIANVTAPVGQIFLNLLFMVVVPIVFSSIALGVSQLGEVGRLGRLSTKTLSYFVFSSAVASLLGLVPVGAIRPGDGFDPLESKRPHGAVPHRGAGEARAGGTGEFLA